MILKLRILTVGNQPRARQSMRALLGVSNQIEQVGEAANGSQAVQLAGEFQPDSY